MSQYPLDIVDDRVLPQDYNGPIHIWDVDKTYLATRFSSAKHLARIPFEFAIDKKAIPGMPCVLRGIRRGTSKQFACTPLYFISASPPILRPAIERKMSIDGVDYDGITFKDWAAIIRSLRLRRLREQIGFKVCGLLTSRLKRPLAEEYLYGDDVEFDASAYSLYASLLHPDLNTAQAEVLLRNEAMGHHDQKCIIELFEQLPKQRGPVQQIYIHLENASSPSTFSHFGPLLKPVNGAIQLSLSLYQNGLVDARTVREAKEQTRQASVFQRINLDAALSDAISRGLISEQKAKELDF